MSILFRAEPLNGMAGRNQKELRTRLVVRLAASGSTAPLWLMWISGVTLRQARPSCVWNWSTPLVSTNQSTCLY